MYTEEALEEKHMQRLSADCQLPLCFAKADRAKQRYEEKVNTLIYKNQFSKPKAEAKVQLDERPNYMKMKNLIREYKVKEIEVARLKAEYYHIRRGLDGGKSLDIEASR